MGYHVHNIWLKINRIKYLWKFPKSIRRYVSKLVCVLPNQFKADQIRELFLLDVLNINSVFPLLRRVMPEKYAKNLINIESSGGTSSSFSGGTPSSILASKFDQGFDYNVTAASIGDLCTYIQNILLRDADMMSMSVALEIRAPFLDYKLVEYLLSLPDKFKVSRQFKKLLCDSLGIIISEEVKNRKKRGFNFPWDEWIRTDLREYCEEKISVLKDHSFINQDKLSEMWDNFLSGKDKSISWVNIWSCVVLSVWLSSNINDEKG